MQHSKCKMALLLIGITVEKTFIPIRFNSLPREFHTRAMLIVTCAHGKSATQRNG